MSRATLASAALLIFLLSLACPAQTSQAPPAPRSATVPFLLEDNRVFVDLTFTKPDGSPRSAHFWVDTGGGGFLMAEPLARDLGLDLSGKPMEEDGAKLLAVTPPAVRIGNLPLDMKDARVLVMMGHKTIQDGFNHAEGMLPGHVLQRYQVVIDYGTQRFTLALPGTLKMRGTRLNTPVQQHMGFPRLEATIAGKSYGFLLDCGAAYTMISQNVLDEWAKAHPEWPRATGAVGAPNMGVPMEVGLEVTRVPQMLLGPLQLRAIGMVARRKGIFEDRISPAMTGPIAGAIAGNVLRNYRVQIDYAEGATYLEKIGNPSPNANDLDVVGLILQPRPDGSFTVLGVAQKDGKPVVEGIEKKDRLLKIEGRDVVGKTLQEVLQSLQGKPGEIRHLVLEREGKPVTIAAPVVHLL
jgi:predicted aspartyl protease